MSLTKVLRLLAKAPFQIFFYPCSFLLILVLSKSNIYNLIYKNYYKKDVKKSFNFNRYLVDLNYYNLPYFLQKKLISASQGNPIEGVIWAESYRKLGFPDKFFDKKLAYGYLLNYIQRNKDERLCIHQVCASSGREINYFSKFSESIIFEASDINEEIAQNIKNNYKNLICYKIDLSNQNDLLKIVKRSNLIVAFGGLQYLMPRDLEKFFKFCKKENAEIILSQPYDVNLSPFSLKKSIPRGDFSWSHPYLNLAKKNKFKINAIASYFLTEAPWSQIISAHFSI